MPDAPSRGVAAQEQTSAPATDRGAGGHGWVVVAALAVVMGVGVGITFYGISIYLAALSDGPRAFSITWVSTATGCFLLVGGTAGLGVAWLLRRADARVVVFGGLLVSAVAILAIGQVRAEWHLLLAYGLLGVGFSAISVIPASNLVAAWFVERRALAMSVAFTGLPIGGALLSPAIAALVESVGVARASPVLAGVLVLVAGPAALLLRSPPPTGQHAAQDGEHTDEAAAVPLREAVRSRWFFVVTAALTLGMLSQLALLTHLYNAVGERFDARLAAAAVSVVAAASLVGRILGAWALARVRLRTATVVLLATQGLAVLGLGVAPGAAVVLVATAAFGMTMGNLQVMQPLLLAEQFGYTDFARILARGNLLVMVGMAAGPVGVGLLHDAAGDYRGALVAAAVPALVGSVLMAWSARFELARRGTDAARP